MAGGKIQSISLARVPFDDAQLKHLETLAELEKLNLDGSDVSDAGLEAVGRLSNLRELSLSFTSISDRGLAYLAPLTPASIKRRTFELRFLFF